MKEDEEPTLHSPDLHLVQQFWAKLEMKQISCLVFGKPLAGAAEDLRERGC